MDTILSKLKDFKKIIYVVLCALFVFMFLCAFIQDIDNDAGASTVIVHLFQYVFEGAIFAAGLYGLLKGKGKFCTVAFALILGSSLYGLVSSVLNGMQAFRYFDGAPASYILYYVFLFITGLFGTAFAVLAVLGWMLGKEDFKKYSGLLGVIYVCMSVLMIIFTIVMVADDRFDWTMIVSAIFAVLFRAFVLILTQEGELAYVEGEAAPAKEEKKAKEEPKEEAPAEEPKEEAPAEEPKAEEAPAEEPKEDTPAEA